MKNKKTIISVILFLLFIAVVIVFGALSERREIIQTEIQKTAPQPTIPVVMEGELKLKISFNKDQFNFPSELPILNYSLSTINETTARKIASNLNFRSEPIISRDIREGIKYIWSDDNYFLAITPSISTIRYSRNSLPNSTLRNTTNDEDIVNISSRFISENLLIPENNLKFLNTVYYEENMTSEGFLTANKTEADIFQSNFTYTTSDFKIMTLSPSKPLILVSILPDGQIFSAEMVKIDNISASEQKYKLKQYNDIENSLDKAILMSVLYGYIDISNLKTSDLSSIDIDKIELVYLMDNPKSTTLIPVYLLEGSVSIIGTSISRAVFYLPAILNP